MLCVLFSYFVITNFISTAENVQMLIDGNRDDSIVCCELNGEPKNCGSFYEPQPILVENQLIQKGWNKISSVEYILDRRWENFKIKKFQNAKGKNVVLDRGDDVFLSMAFSVFSREDFQVIVDLQPSGMEYLKMHSNGVSYCTMLICYESDTFIGSFSTETWNHFFVKIVNDDVFICSNGYVFQQYLHTDIYKVSLHSNSTKMFWKIHENEYFYIDTGGIDSLIFNISSTDILRLSVFVAMCNVCKMTISIIIDDQKEFTKFVNVKPKKQKNEVQYFEDLSWQKVDVDIEETIHKKIAVHISRYTTGFGLRYFWAVDDLQFVKKTGYEVRSMQISENVHNFSIYTINKPGKKVAYSSLNLQICGNICNISHTDISAAADFFYEHNRILLYQEKCFSNTSALNCLNEWTICKIELNGNETVGNFIENKEKNNEEQEGGEDKWMYILMVFLVLLLLFGVAIVVKSRIFATYINHCYNVVHNYKSIVALIGKF